MKRSLKKEFPILIVVIILLFTTFAITASIIYAKSIYVDTSSLQSQKTSTSAELFPTEIHCVKSDVYTTPYGTYEPISDVMEINEYLTLNHTMLTAEQSQNYISPSEDKEICRKTMDEIKKIADDICSGLTDEYDKVTALAMWTGKHLIYDFDAMNTNGSDLSVTSLEAILKNDYQTTCGGFSNFFSALCFTQDIYCVNFKGGSSSQGYTRAELDTAPANHEWNGVVINGEWHYVDCTWISDLNVKNGKISGGNNILPFYAVFGFGEMSIEHRIDRSEHRCYNVN